MKKAPSKDEALEALDFIINVLKEHEKDLDRLIGELGNITSSVGEAGEMSSKIEKVEDRLSTLQNEISNLVSCLSSPSSSTLTTTPTPKTGSPLISKAGPPVIVRCKQWEDFKALASGADTVSFLFRESERTFQTDALKDGRVFTYNGELPKDTRLLRLWLAGELQVEGRKILEGVLAIG